MKFKVRFETKWLKYVKIRLSHGLSDIHFVLIYLIFYFDNFNHTLSLSES